ncbi:uncharacterized protein LOC112043256 [Bicyclus anynana]|uniref:Uncharacterized protein LOC112043256 n=1 Tax=Bicyclus anynana TaxID=110368 RepID=A0A6J1MV58_BICAN|nr:uncharacterized protein LOC112043256 [Bicyclus anynana]
MLFFIFLLLITRIAWCNHVGSTIFYKRSGRAGCWSQEDIARLRARKIFEDNIIPPIVPPHKVNDEYIKETLKYFRNALKTTETGLDKKSAVILEDVLLDTIGAHLRSEILPAVRFAFYAGYVPYRRVRELHDFYDHIKRSLNTQGLGWRRPSTIPKLSNITVEKIRIGSGRHFTDPCLSLVTKRDANSCIHLPPLKTDDDSGPTAVSLPFKTGGLVKLVSPSSQNILLKYYTTASRCVLHNSPKTCRHNDFVNFNNELWHWMKRDVAPHLTDENLYAAYGGVLRIAAAAQNYGKVLSRRNIFEYQDPGGSRFHPWTFLKRSYSINECSNDYNSIFYVTVIMMIGFSICLIQVCCSYLTEDNGCQCKPSPKQASSCKDVSYAKVDSNIPAMLPNQNNVFYVEEQTRGKRNKQGTSSLGSIQSQRVYDLHENTEKVMSIVMNDESSEESSPRSKSSGDGSDILNVNQTARSKSPPKIDTPITQIQRRAPKIREQTAMFSPSTVTNSVLTYQRGQGTDSWSGSASSTSAQSFSSIGSKSKCRKSRASRDLEWARRVASKHSLHAKSSGTELDMNSYITPKSHR